VNRLRSGGAATWIRAAGILALVGGAAAALATTGSLPTVAWFEAHPLTAFGVMATPGLAVDGEVLVSGRVPSEAELKQLLG
jgi:hypothetical protein